MTEPRALPLVVIEEKLRADGEYAAVIVSEAAETLQPSDPAHLAVMKAQIELRDHLATRARELKATVDAVEADLALVRAGVWP